MPTVTARPAAAHSPDAHLVAQLWTEAAAWIATTGNDQWQYPVRTLTIEAKINEGVCWLVFDETITPVATLTLDSDADPKLWTPADHPEDALYVHRLVSRRNPRIPGLGAALLDWCSTRARRQGKTWLRLDVWTSNTRLQNYYTAQGFTHVRTVHSPDIPSGALFQRRCHSTTTRHDTNTAGDIEVLSVPHPQ